MKKKKSWQEKLANSNGLPKLEKIPSRMRSKWGRGTLVISAPSEVDAIMRKVPKGKLTTINEIRFLLAKKHKVTIACPITIGIFAWIASHASEEMAAEGKKRVTPYWRTLKSGGFLNEKYPGGIKGQAEHLRAEGHVIEYGKNHKTAKVKEFAKYSLVK